ncbi:cob(I)yrinic acid a,c-diamide adenosyltransferase [Candidatus Uhrbacteria bacterium]|nr:cob(I)yrinic acid a,c-diamide adenosyltransferase [Candidatus Uhrbacteria bacterium]
MPPHPRLQEPWGLIQIFTGNGKGKTTAGLGTILRAVGQGKRAAIIFFDKGGSHYSERQVLQERFPEVSLVATGLDRIDPVTGRFRFGVLPEDKREAERGLQVAQEWILSGTFDLVTLDEINTTVSLGILSEVSVLNLLRQKPRHVEIICTGREAPESFREAADLVTEMQLVKHYFYQGIPARKGLDF